MQWSDEGIVLGGRPHGEGALVAHILTRDRGRHAGLVRGGQSARLRGLYQPGNRVAVTWSARLAEHLGTFQCELIESHSAYLLDEPERLLALSSAASLCECALPEREPHPACFEGFLVLLEALRADHWAEVYVRWELAVLADLGFGLDLESCAGGGSKDQLAYVSPKTGRAVSLAAGELYRDRLLQLPSFLLGRGEGGSEEVAMGLALSGYFFERNIFHPQDRDLPEARRRLADRFMTVADLS